MTRQHSRQHSLRFIVLALLMLKKGYENKNYLYGCGRRFAGDRQWRGRRAEPDYRRRNARPGSPVGGDSATARNEHDCARDGNQFHQ